MMASLYIKDSRTAALVETLARRRGMTKTEAVRRAVEAELARDQEQGSTACRQTARDYLDDFYRRYPIPERRAQRADKAFFDDLSGNL
jgi:antitoxin VapB